MSRHISPDAVRTLFTVAFVLACLFFNVWLLETLQARGMSTTLAAQIAWGWPLVTVVPALGVLIWIMRRR